MMLSTTTYDEIMSFSAVASMAEREWRAFDAGNVIEFCRQFNHLHHEEFSATPVRIPYLSSRSCTLGSFSWCRITSCLHVDSPFGVRFPLSEWPTSHWEVLTPGDSSNPLCCRFNSYVRSQCIL